MARRFGFAFSFALDCAPVVFLYLSAREVRHNT